MERRSRARLAAVTHEGDLVAGRTQIALSLVVQVATFWFVSMSVVGGWALVAGTAVFFAPLVAGLRDWPANAWLGEHAPTGVLKWSAVIGTGAGLAWWIEHAGLRGSTALDVGFVVLALPVVSTWALELFEGEADDEGETRAGPRGFRWGRQLLGAVLVGAMTWLVVAGGAGA